MNVVFDILSGSQVTACPTAGSLRSTTSGKDTDDSSAVVFPNGEAPKEVKGTSKDPWWKKSQLKARGLPAWTLELCAAGAAAGLIVLFWWELFFKFS